MKKVYWVILLLGSLTGCVPTQNTIDPEVELLEEGAQIKSAIHKLCVNYHYGLGVEKNPEQALYWCEMSARTGNNSGQTLIAEIYFFGVGVEKDYPTALDWYLDAAVQKHPHALYMLYFMYRDGLGVEKDIDFALSSLEAASRLGHEEASLEVNCNCLDSNNYNQYGQPDATKNTSRLP